MRKHLTASMKKQCGIIMKNANANWHRNIPTMKREICYEWQEIRIYASFPREFFILESSLLVDKSQPYYGPHG